MIRKIKTIKKLTNSYVVRKTSGIFIISSVVGVFSYLIPVVIASYFGVSDETDNFFLSFTIVSFSASILQGTISSLIVPFVTERKGDKKSLFLFVNSTFTFSALLSCILIVCGYLVIFLFLIDNFTLLSLYLKIILPILLFQIINALFRGILNSLGHYYLVAISDAVRIPFVYIAIFLFHSIIGLKTVLLGYLIGEIITFIVLYIIIKKVIGYWLNLRNFQYDKIKVLVSRGSRQLIASLAASANPLVDKIIASTLALGSITMLDYGQRLFSVLNSVLHAFLIVLLTRWSEKIARSESISSSVYKLITLTFTGALMIAFFVIFFSAQFAQILYGNLPKENYDVILNIFRINTFAFPFIAAMQILNRAVIADKATQLLMRVALFKFVSNIVLDIILAKFYFVEGIAWATFLNHGIGFILMFCLFKKESIGQINIRKDITVEHISENP